MSFLYPKTFLLLLLIPLYLFFIYKNNKEFIYVSVYEDLKEAQKKRWPSFKAGLKNILPVFIIFLFVFILARPQSVHQKENLNKKGIDIIVAMDVSGSMLAEDLKPNRITAAKKAIEKFVSYLQEDRLGVVVFSGAAFTQSPLTFDYNILKDYINRISTESINQNISGTAIGDAILASENRFKKSKDRTKVLVLLTDGDANTGVDPIIAAKKASEDGIKIYTIGIGGKDGAPLPYIDVLGNKTYARNRDGSLVMATFNEDALKNIAQIGDGKYFRAEDKESFEEAMKEINQLEKREIKTSVTTEYTELFFPFLVILYCMVLLYLAIDVKVINK